MKRYTVTVNGKAYDVTVEASGVSSPAVSAPVTAAAPSSVAPASPVKPVVQAAAPSASGNAKVKVNSPMPGTILSMNVKDGDNVTKGQVLCVLEAMKMENEITAPDSGKVVFAAAKGSSVKTGDLLVSLA